MHQRQNYPLQCLCSKIINIGLWSFIHHWHCDKISTISILRIFTISMCLEGKSGAAVTKSLWILIIILMTVGISPSIWTSHASMSKIIKTRYWWQLIPHPLGEWTSAFYFLSLFHSIYLRLCVSSLIYNITPYFLMIIFKKGNWLRFFDIDIWISMSIRKKSV